MHRIHVSGDQLMAARIRGAQKAKSNGESPEKRLKGIISVVENWHILYKGKFYKGMFKIFSIS